MSLSVGWIAGPLAAAMACVVYWGYKMARAINRIDLRLPVREVRITGIHAPDVGTPRGLYMVTFATTGSDAPFYLDAPEIIDRCSRHQQKVPSFVAADPKAPADRAYLTGDDLVVGIGSNSMA